MKVLWLLELGQQAVFLTVTSQVGGRMASLQDLILAIPSRLQDGELE